MNVIAVDLGGTKLAVASVQDGRIRQRVEVPTATSGGPAEVVRQIVELVSTLARPDENTRLAVASTGRVQQGRVTALNATMLPGWDGFDLQSALIERTGLPTTILNDADAAALGEARLGAGRHLPAMLFVTISTGVGAGIVLNGVLLQSPSGVHADFGYLHAASGEVIEAVASGLALERWIREQGYPGRAQQLIEWARTEPRAEERLELAVSTLVRGFGDVRVLLGVEDVIVGGSVGLNPEFLGRLQRCAGNLPELYRVVISPAALGADAGLYGAALFGES